MTRGKRILYVQYTNPAVYPPLEHSSHILADAGWRVQFLGIACDGANDLTFPPHPNVIVRQLGFQPPGWKQKLHYIGFVAWCLAWCLTWRPKVVYCSDLWSAPIGVLAWYLFRVPVIYHEHDTAGAPTSAILRMIYAMRRRLACVAAACVIPQKERLTKFVESLRPRRAICVWNCPRRDEVLPPERHRRTDALNLFYVGSLSPALLPEAMARVLADLSHEIKLHVVGYETIGSTGYIQRFTRLAAELGVADRVCVYGPLSRRDFFRVASGCDVGLCLIPSEAGDVNLRLLFGASNKLFDYLACGLAVVVPNQREWTSHVVEHGYGVGCDVDRTETFSSVFRELCSRPAELRRMGEAGRQRILKDWNYETQFQPVERLLNAL